MSYADEYLAALREMGVDVAAAAPPVDACYCSGPCFRNC